MPEIRSVTTLHCERDEISAPIPALKKKLEQARADPAHATTAIRIFAGTDRLQDVPRHVDCYRLFKRGERGRSAPPRLLKDLRRPRNCPGTIARWPGNRLIHSPVTRSSR